MIDPRTRGALPRPAPAADRGALDDRFYDLVEERFVRLVRDNPVLGTALGLHHDDDVLGDGSREQVLAELAAERAHLSAVEPSTPQGCPPARGSSATSRSTTFAARSSKPTSSASGSADRSRSTPSATACSCCSPAITRRWPIGSR
jgi:hypothetical protein